MNSQQEDDKRTLMFNIDDVRVGYNLQDAKQFKLEGSQKVDPLSNLPNLKVDADIPYMKYRRHTVEPGLATQRHKDKSSIASKTSKYQ